MKDFIMNWINKPLHSRRITSTFYYMLFKDGQPRYRWFPIFVFYICPWSWDLTIYWFNKELYFSKGVRNG